MTLRSAGPARDDTDCELPVTAQRQRFEDQRWHFQHGPIDLIIAAEGDSAGVDAAHEAAWTCFESILQNLVDEWPLLRQGVDFDPSESPDPARENQLRGPVARRMWEACAAVASPKESGFITPMAAVAGAVAEELIQFYQRPGITRAWVNNGGDIALYLTSDTRVRIGLVSDLARAIQSSPACDLVMDGELEVHHDMPVRGLATSGWRGRSHSLGIADSVTVLAKTAAKADAAATLIANAVNVDDSRIERRPANSLRDHSDLGARLVTVNVPALAYEQVLLALQRGCLLARAFAERGLIHSALLACQGQFQQHYEATS